MRWTTDGTVILFKMCSRCVLWFCSRCSSKKVESAVSLTDLKEQKNIRLMLRLLIIWFLLSSLLAPLNWESLFKAIIPSNDSSGMFRLFREFVPLNDFQSWFNFRRVFYISNVQIRMATRTNPGNINDQGNMDFSLSYGRRLTFDNKRKSSFRWKHNKIW